MPSDDLLEAFHDESGLFGIAGHVHAAKLTSLGLFALQHRGPSTAGMVVSDGAALYVRRGVGAVEEVFSEEPFLLSHGRMALGQVSRSTDHAGSLPIVASVRGGQIAVCLAGRLVNSQKLCQDLEERGAVRTTSTDAELLLQLIAQSNQRTVLNRLVDALWRVEGAFSLLVCYEDRLIAVRDPRGFRPLVLGRIGSAYAVASEGCAIQAAGGEVLREVAAGEMVILDPSGATTVAPFPRRARAACIQEMIGIANLDARLYGMDVYAARLMLGERLAKDAPAATGELVIGIPGLGEAMAVGYARASQLPYEQGLIHTGGKTISVEGMRWNGVPSVIAERRIVVVAASMVTGKGFVKIVQALRRSRAQEIHLRLCSPLTITACRYGVASATDDEIVGIQNFSLQQLAQHLDVDSIDFLSFEALNRVLGTNEERTWCSGCLTGEWPIALEADGQLGLFDTDEI